MNQQIKHIIASSRFRLAATYLAIIMLMSIGFSIVFYQTSSRALDRQVPPDAVIFRSSNSSITTTIPQQSGNRIRDFLSDRADEGRHDLALRLIAINMLTLLAGAGISYVLARRTLEPIEANMEAQRQFVSDASHELRTPLTAIQTSNEVALRNKKLTLTDAKAIIKDNISEVAKLKQLSDGLLDLAKNDQQQRKLEEVSLHSAVQDALNQIVSNAQARNISVDDSTSDLKVRTNPAILSEILVILMDNAVKYSHESGTIYLSTTTKGNFGYLHVRDEGVGIRASDIPHLFRRFYRADNARSTADQDGYGLGLAIADSLARSHNANVSVTSELHKGSTFTIKLQLVK